ncbi:MAG: hypothetical protein KIT44_01380 [Opitutaceae bacterium]|nr:hypothetical protein [Opitutaceae bacterium]
MKISTIRAGRHSRALSVLGLLALTVALPARAETTRAEVLLAIHWVENPRNVTKPGPKGELGPYQFREPTWRMHTQAPFRRALDREQAATVARRHYDWIVRGLVRNGLPVTPYNIALAWNGGLSATVRGRVPAAAHRYAERVHNLAEEMRRLRLAQNQAPPAGQ